MIGHTRSLAAILIIDALLQLHLPADAIQGTEQGCRLLQSLKYIYATYVPITSTKDLGVQALLAKFRGSERQAPDVLQLCETFKLMADEEAVHKGVKGVSGEGDKLIDWAITSYNTSTSNNSIKVHGVAKTAVKTVLIQSPGFIETVRKAWMMTKVRESAITVDVLASPFLRALKMDNGLSENQFWKDMLTPTTLKNQWWVKRALGAWESRVSMAQEQSGTGFNLRSKPARPPEPTPPHTLAPTRVC